MADLTACYFCGDSTVEEYPVIPPRWDPPEDAQRTVALCPDCHGKLGAVLETVVGFVGEGTRADRTGGPTTGGGRAGGEPAGDDVWFGRREAAEGDEGGGASVTGPAEGDEGGGTSVTGPTEGDEGGASVTGPADGDVPTGATGGDPAPVPESYSKVLRLLQNREFPVERAEFETVAANAYELSAGEVGAALDAAVDRGLVVEEAGTLHRPE